jgi:oligoendopeptidase F
MNTVKHMLKSGIIGNANRSAPDTFFELMLIKSILTRDQSLAQVRKRQAVMSQQAVTMLLEFFRPILMALFEYYLHETYSSSSKKL